MEKVYGPGSGECYVEMLRDREAQQVPPLSPGTRRAIERLLTERELWLEVGNVAWRRFAAHAHHGRVSLHHIARLCEVASQLGRCAAGLPLTTRTKPPGPCSTPDPYLSFDECMRKAYGENQNPSPTCDTTHET